MSEAPEPRTRKAQEGKARQKRGFMVGSTISEAGKALPAFPTSPAELAAQWDVGNEDTYGLMVKVTRPCGGTVELVADVPLRDYNAGDLAGKLGPGLYYLRGASGKYVARACKMIFSEEYARSNGFGTVQPPPLTASDLKAEATLRKAAEGPTDPLDLMAAFDRFYDLKRAAELRTQAPAAVDPMAMIQNQFNQMGSIMEMMRSMEERAIKTVEMRMGIAKPEGEEMDTNSSMMERLLLKGLEVFGPMVAQAMKPASPTFQQAPTQPIPQAQPNPAPTLENKPMPNLDDNEKKAIAGAVSMLRPFADTLLELAASNLTDDQIIENLDPYIPEALTGSIIALSVIAQKYGPNVLGAIHPGLATDRWVTILAKLAEGMKP